MKQKQQNNILEWDFLKYGTYPGGESMLSSSYLRIVLLASVPGIGISAYVWGSRILLMYLVSWIAGLLVESIFSMAGKSPFRGSSTVTAALLVLLLPVSTPLLPLAFASAFAIFAGQEIFGGAGYHIVNPALLAKLVLMTGYLQEIQGPSFASAFEPDLSGLTIVSGILMTVTFVVLVILRRENLFVAGGLVLGTILTVLWMKSQNLMPYDSLIKTIMLDGFAFVICFVVLDPATTPSNRNASLVYGLIVSSLAFLVGIFSDKYSSGIVIATLFGNLISPLLDELFNQSKKNSL